MGRRRKNCSVFGCRSSNLAKLSNHLAQVHNMDTEERKKWLKWSEIGICVSLKDKAVNEKEIHMAYTSERQQTLITFLRVQRTHRKRNSTRTKQTC